MDSDLNIINQQHITSGSYYINICIVKDKLMVYYHDYYQDNNLIIKLYNSDLTSYKTNIIEDEIGYYDYSSNRFSHSVQYFEDINELSYYYEFNNDYDMVKKNYKTRVVKKNCSEIQLYDFENNKVLKKILDTDLVDNYIEFREIREINGKYYVFAIGDDGENYIYLFDNNLNLIKTRHINTIFESGFFGPYIDKQTYFELSAQETADLYFDAIKYYFDEELNDIKYIPYVNSIRETTYNNDKLLRIGYRLLHSDEDREIVIAGQKIKNKYFYLSINYKTGILNLSIYNENETLYKKVNVTNTATPYEIENTTGNIVLMDDKIIVDCSSLYEKEGEQVKPTQKVYDLDGNELNYDTSNIYEDYKTTLSTIEDGDQKIFSLMEQMPSYSGDDDEALYTNNIKVVKLLREANIESMNGDVTLDTDELYQGKEVTLNIKPKSGYKVKCITVKDQDGNIIEVKDNKFIYPDGDITIDVEYETSVNPNTIDKILGFLMFDIVSVISLLLLVFIYRKRNLYNY